MSNYRDRKLLDLAHQVNECQLRLPGCQGYTEGCEPAHSNQLRHGKGMGIKAHDHYHVSACHNCHMMYDGQIKHTIDRCEMDQYWQEGWERTMDLYFRNGWLGVK